MEEIINKIMENNLNKSIAVVVIGILVYIILKGTLNKVIERNKDKKTNKKKKTYVRLFRNILKYIISIIVIVCVLQVNGINVTSIVAGLGLVSIIAGLALQDALKDIIMGLNLIIDDYFSVGDVLKINNVEGKVTEIGIKATKLKDVNTDCIFVIANRNISQALILSNQLDIDIPIRYEESIERIEGIINNNLIEQLSNLEHVTEIGYRGIKEFASSAIYYKIRMQCKPEFKAQTIRDANRIIKIELDKNNIQIPYTQIDVHNK